MRKYCIIFAIVYNDIMIYLCLKGGAFMRYNVRIFLGDSLVDVNLVARSYFSIGSGPNDNYRIDADDICDRQVVIRMIDDVCYVSEKGSPERELKAGEIFVISERRKIAILTYSPDTPNVFSVDLSSCPVIEIGRNSMCNIVLKESCVSRKHARVFFAEGRFYVQDLDSSNGTFLNKKRIVSSELNEGDIISLGSYDILFKKNTLTVGHF